MFNNIVTLKKLKDASEEVEILEDKYINENNEALIYVKANSCEDIISKYSSGDNVTFNEELSNYLEEEVKHLPITYPINIKINNEKEFKQKEKDKVKLALRNCYTKKVNDCNKQLNSNKTESIVLLFLTLIFLIGYVLIKVYASFEILSELLLLVAWVFGWRLTESLAFHRKDIRKEAIKFYRLLNARIDFLN